MIGYRQPFQKLNALALGQPHGARGAHAASTRHDDVKALHKRGQKSQKPRRLERKAL